MYAHNQRQLHFQDAEFSFYGMPLDTIIEVSVHMSREIAFLDYMGKEQSGTNPILLSNVKSFVLVL